MFVSVKQDTIGRDILGPCQTVDCSKPASVFGVLDLENFRPVCGVYLEHFAQNTDQVCNVVYAM